MGLIYIGIEFLLCTSNSKRTVFPTWRFKWQLLTKVWSLNRSDSTCVLEVDIKLEMEVKSRGEILENAKGSWNHAE